MEFAIPGLIFGYAAARGKFCLNSGFADAAKKDFRKVNILIFAALVQIVLMPVYLHAGFVPLPFAYSVFAVALGAFLFGLLMPFAGGCTAGIVCKAGEGSPGAAVATVGFFAAMGLAYQTPVKSLIDKLASQGPVSLPATTLNGRYAAAALSIILLFYLIVFVKNAKAAGAVWTWRRTAIVISLALTLHAVLSGLRGRAMGIFFVPGFVDFWALKFSPDLFFLLSVPVGAALTRIGQPGALWQPLTWKIFFIRLVAGFGLGLAAALAGGCSVGYSLGLLPALSLHALLSIFSIFAGRVLSLQFVKYSTK